MQACGKGTLGRKLHFHQRSITSITESATKQHHVRLLQLNQKLAALTRSARYDDALHLFDKILKSYQHLKPDHYTLSTVITACANARNVSFGNQLHAYATRTGLIVASHHVANTLLSLYAKARDLVSVKQVFSDIHDPDFYSWTTLLSACVKHGDVGFACELFDKIPKRDVAIWNAMITGCMENGHEDIGVGLFREMHRLGVIHDNYSYASVLSECFVDLIDFGRQVHSLVIKTGSFVRPSVVNALLTMYFNCHNVVDAYTAFDEAVNYVYDQITYNVMIDGLVSLGRAEEAFELFIEMLETYMKPTDLTFVSLMSSCLDASVGYQVHALSVKMGFEAYTSVGNAMITMYSNFADLRAAYTVFGSLEAKDLVSWNTMISSYAQMNLGRSAILAYAEMQRIGIEPDEFTFGSLLTSSEFVVVVEMIQSLAIKNGLISKIYVSNALVSAYSQQGLMNEAYQIFHVSPKNLISWNTVISGLLLNGLPTKGFEQFSNLLNSGLRPNAYTFSIVLSICASISALQQGKQIHNYILRKGFSSIASLGNALMTMYAKCGALDWSSRIFNLMNERDVISWNGQISAYAQHGQGREAVDCFEAMQAFGVKPDQTTFTTLLSACSHTGLVDDGIQIFNSMVNSFEIVPGDDHYSCVVDLLSRAGHFDEVERIINDTHFQVHSKVWWTLFSACAAHGNSRLGRLAAQNLLESENDESSVYVVLSNIYAAAGEWEEAANIRELMQNNGVMKQPGSSWVSL
ncbi:pentatricopeptide repeat-containing protein [Tripterygium wilfordii]|uniref:Pentatricopeptide repeat-containing protein n=1 Tax=Tripterygium wilfordii TaxID=458696 RepID=A0A7J7DTT1_TRIWF|nr:pentatricopeptide repeat-containing protein At3g49740 [Tripterygium wilfordii]KAF5749699.1 pentatricopeptide repeat-containing protein [Tripterygium wilfordii]